MTQRTDERPKGLLNLRQYVNNDYSTQDLENFAYELTPEVLRSWPFLLSTLEGHNFIVATGTSTMHIAHRTFDAVQRRAGLTTGTAWHARKQHPVPWYQGYFRELGATIIGRICNW